jgi:prephenate dehydratase
MTISIAHLGPPGTYAEAAALLYSTWLTGQTQQETTLCPYPSIAQTIEATTEGQVDLAVVPVENSIEGSVTTTLDTLWRCDTLQIQQALVLPISHAFITRAKTIAVVKTVYSHPQALAQCHQWLEKFLPEAQIIPTNSTTEALQYLDADLAAGAIASERAAQLYNLPVLACPINDHPDNCTRFWILGLQPSLGGNCTSLAFTVHDVPGALLKPLQVFAQQNINLSKIESRPTKKSLGDYLFFVDLEADARQPNVQVALKDLAEQTETLKVFGSYDVLPT